MDAYGNFSSEFEAAYDLSRREAQYPREQHLVDGHVAAGKHVLVFTAAQYCGFTDAILGSSVQVVSVHDAKEEAQAALALVHPGEDCADDIAYYVASPRPVVAGCAGGRYLRLG
jgi:hypothetical protein